MAPRDLYFSLYEELDGSGFYAVFHRGKEPGKEPVFYIETKVRGSCQCQARVFALGFSPGGRPVMYAGVDELELDTMTAVDVADFALAVYRGEDTPCALRCKEYRAGPETVRRKLGEAVGKLSRRLASGEVVPIAERILVSGRRLEEILEEVMRGGP